MKIAFVSALGLLLVHAQIFAAQVDVRHLDKIDGHVKTADGFFFALPRTVIAADVTIEGKTFKPGNFAKYAILYFPEAYKDEGNPEEKSRSFSLKDATFTSRGEPDPDWVFWINMKSGLFLDRSLTMQMTEAGTVTGATATVDNTLPDFLMSVLGTATGLASKAILAGDGGCVKPDSKDKFIRCILMRNDPQKIADYEDVIAANPKAKVASDKVKNEIEENPKGDFHILAGSRLSAADKLFGSFFELDQDKYNAVHSAKAGVGVGDLVTQIEALKDTIKKQFTGTAEPLTWTGHFEFRPTSGVTQWALMNLDPKTGACLNPAMFQGKSALTKDLFSPRKGPECTNVGEYTLKVVVENGASNDLQTQLKSKNVKQYDKTREGQGLPYRLPADVRFRMQSDTKPTAFFSNILVAQSGLVLALPAKLGGRQTKAGLTYFETTGAVKALDTTGKTILNKSVADAAGSSATGLLDANITANKAAAAKVDPLAVLTRQRQLLEEQSKIIALCATLGMTDCAPAGKQ